METPQDETVSKKKKVVYLPAVLSIASLFGFLLFVSPDEENFLLSLIPMVLLWMAIYFVVGAGVDYSGKMGGALGRIVRISSASVAVLVVMFSALGQLSVLDVVSLVSLVALGSFYFDRTWKG